jgi:hypothetical protein
MQSSGFLVDNLFDFSQKLWYDINRRNKLKVQS